jgi:hypothetical protein
MILWKNMLNFRLHIKSFFQLKHLILEASARVFSRAHLKGSHGSDRSTAGLLARYSGPHFHVYRSGNRATPFNGLLRLTKGRIPCYGAFARVLRAPTLALNRTHRHINTLPGDKNVTHHSRPPNYALRWSCPKI